MGGPCICDWYLHEKKETKDIKIKAKGSRYCNKDVNQKTLKKLTRQECMSTVPYLIYRSSQNPKGIKKKIIKKHFSLIIREIKLKTTSLLIF